MPKTTENHIDINVTDPNWHELIPGLEGFCRKVLLQTLPLLHKPLTGELSIALINDEEMRTLNRTYRQKNTPTNVLSFPNPGPDPLLGDIVISRETVIKEAEERAKPIQHHFTHMLVHGFLHLQGYNHEKDDEAEIMEQLEINILQTFDIDNPYETHEP